MSFTIDQLIYFDGEESVDLRAQLLSNSGSAIDDPIDSGFHEIGGGYYNWHYENIEDGWRGLIKFYDILDTTSCVISSVDAVPEYLDAKASSLSTFDPTSQKVDLVNSVNATACNALADAILGRDIAEAEATAAEKSLATVVLAIANKSNTKDNPNFLTIYRTDDTEHVRIPVSTNASAVPINGLG